MKRVAIVIALLLLSCLPASAQLSAYHDRALAPVPLPGIPSLVVVPIAYGQVRVCNGNVSNSPCTPVASIFDLQGNTLSVVGGNFGQVTTDVTGQFSFQCAAGIYTVQVAASASNTPQLTYLIACPVTNAVSVTTTGSGAMVLQNGPTINGATITNPAISSGTITNPSLAGTVAGAPTWNNAQTFPGLTTTGATSLFGNGSLLISPTAPTISSGFGTSPVINVPNGTAAFVINVGTGGTANSGIIGLPAATSGWNCWANDQSDQTTRTVQNGSTTTSANFVNVNSAGTPTAWVSGHSLTVSCFAR